MKLYIDKRLDLYEQDNKVKLLSEFCLFCAEKLEVRPEFEIYVISDRDDHEIMTTAAYHVGKNICKVYGKDRALVDILRSIAHEMTHMMQDQQGLLVGKIQDAGGFHEDQANSRAGELIKKFAKSKDYRKSIYESIVY